MVNIRECMRCNGPKSVQTPSSSKPHHYRSPRYIPKWCLCDRAAGRRLTLTYSASDCAISVCCRAVWAKDRCRSNAGSPRGDFAMRSIRAGRWVSGLRPLCHSDVLARVVCCAQKNARATRWQRPIPNQANEHFSATTCSPRPRS
jgi:hypothetical protein